MEHITKATNEVLIDLMARWMAKSGYYNFMQGQQAEAELRSRGVKVWKIDWHQSTEKIASPIIADS